MSFGLRALIHFRHSQRRLQRKVQNCFARQLDLLAFCRCLSAAAQAATRRRSDPRSFSAARKSADDRPNHRARPNFLCRVL